MKIFGVGPNKTGTVSIAEACNRLGLRVLHNRKKGERLCRALGVQSSKLVDPVIDELDNYDVFLDGPYHEVINEIRETIDDPRFICLDRDIDEWINSRIVHCLHNRVMGSGSWREIDTDAWRDEFRDIQRSIANNLQTEDRYMWMNVAAGDGWEPLCKLIGCDAPDSRFPHFHTAPEKLLQIHSKKSKRRPLQTAPIILGVRYFSDWYAGENHVTHHWIPKWNEIMKWWYEVFEMPYSRYRARLQDIARRNWARIAGLDSIVSLNSWKPELFHDAVVIPIDDDDWLDITTCRILRNFLTEGTTAISWPAERTECLFRYSAEKWGDAERFIGNGYALTPNYRDQVGDEQYLESLMWHLQASQHAKNHQAHTENLLAVAPRHWASCTILKTFNSSRELRAKAYEVREWHKSSHPQKRTETVMFKQEFNELHELNQELLEGIK